VWVDLNNQDIPGFSGISIHSRKYSHTHSPSTVASTAARLAFEVGSSAHASRKAPSSNTATQAGLEPITEPCEQERGAKFRKTACF
jgi:hypothetical protein